MKAIIFDLDNTLIEWKPEFVQELKNILIEYKLSDEQIKQIDSLIDNHENVYDKLSKENLLEYINKNSHITLDMEVIDKLIEAQKNCIYDDQDMVETIKYLSKKYDLYILTNWFTETQKGRLEKMKIAKYFKKVIGGDENYYKPNKEAFTYFLNKYSPDDCLFVGDSLKKDVEPAQKLGMHVIWKTNKISKKYQTIKEIKELKQIL